MTANDADMCAAATDAGVVTEFGGGGGGRKERGGARRKRERGRERGGEMDGQRGQRVDNGPDYDDDERARS